MGAYTVETWLFCLPVLLLAAGELANEGLCQLPVLGYRVGCRVGTERWAGFARMLSVGAGYLGAASYFGRVTFENVKFGFRCFQCLVGLLNDHPGLPVT